MNWRLSSLDRFTLLSNSDSHSAWPWRIGRESNVFEFERPSYRELIDAIRKKDGTRLKFTIETDPAYGKYHWTGHRACNVSLSPKEAAKFGGICPVCRKKLTKGVEQRVEELADRPEGYVPDGAIPFERLLPLHEILATALGTDQLASKGVWDLYNRLLNKFGNEYRILMEVSREELSSAIDPAIADLIVSVREGKVRVEPGYDGVYGRLMIGKALRSKGSASKVQSRIQDFL